MTGRGTIVGINMENCIGFATKNKVCRICQIASKSGKAPRKQDCHKNFCGTAKSMEPATCEELFSKASYQVMIGDEDSSSEARVKKNVNPDIEKWADKNHIVRTSSKYLNECKSIDFGLDNDKLTDSVREYIMHCFPIALTQNKGDVIGLQRAIRSIVPHAFGDHLGCGDWCRFEKILIPFNIETYHRERFGWLWIKILFNRDFGTICKR